MRYALATVLVVIVAATAAIAIRAWLARGRRPRRRRRARLAHPIVLAHGLFGFDSIEVAGRRVDYWKGIATRIRRAGAECHIAKVPPTASVRKRARALADHVRALDAPKVNVIAHSMGGIDARYAVSMLGLGDRVASVVTIGTPHRGTPLADVGAAAARLGVEQACARFGVPLDGLDDARGRRMSSFNRRVRDVDGIHYASFVGSARDVSAMLLPGWLYLRAASGDNDGVVPAASQMWGEVIGEIDADHWAQIGWGGGSRFDARAFYASLVRELRGRGL